jgi:hypothetical protein
LVKSWLIRVAAKSLDGKFKTPAPEVRLLCLKAK